MRIPKLGVLAIVLANTALVSCVSNRQAVHLELLMPDNAMRGVFNVGMTADDTSHITTNSIYPPVGVLVVRNVSPRPVEVPHWFGDEWQLVILARSRAQTNHNLVEGRRVRFPGECPPTLIRAHSAVALVIGREGVNPVRMFDGTETNGWILVKLRTKVSGEISSNRIPVKLLELIRKPF